MSHTTRGLIALAAFVAFGLYAAVEARAWRRGDRPGPAALRPLRLAVLAVAFGAVATVELLRG